MAHYGLLHDYRFEDIATAEDIRGTKVYGRNDEKLGTIDDVIFDHATGTYDS
jgi:sporulation protein YlmC with PRC-barrel domain